MRLPLFSIVRAPRSLRIAAATLLLALAAPGHAVIRIWIGPDGGIFGDPKNWEPGGVPTGSDVAIFDTAGPVTVHFFGDAEHYRLQVDRGTVILNLHGHVYGLTTTTGSGVIVAQPAQIASLTILDGRIDCRDVVVAPGSASDATLSVSGAGHIRATGQLFVGYSSPGHLHVGSGGRVNTAALGLGFLGDGRGMVTVTGVGSSVVVAGPTEVGAHGIGELSVIDSASMVTGPLTLGAQPTGLGIVQVALDASLSAVGPIAVGAMGSGDLSVSDGGQLSSNGASTIGASTAVSGVARVIGATSLWTNLPGAITLDVPNAMLTVEGDGRVSADAVHVAQGVVQGDGMIVGALDVQTGGTLRPGSGTGTLEVDGTYEQADGRIEVELGGEVAGESYDVLSVTGAAALSGASDRLRVLLVDGFVPGAGQVFKFLKALTRTGRLESLALPALPSDRDWRLWYDGETVALSVVPCRYRVAQFDPSVGDFVDLGCIEPYPTDLSIADFYGYGTPDPAQRNFPIGAAPVPANDQSQLFLIDSAVDGLALCAVHDRSVVPHGGVGGGSAEMTWRLSGDPTGAGWLVLDDPVGFDDVYTGGNGDWSFTSDHFWGDYSDGAVLGPLDGPWSIRCAFADVGGGGEIVGLVNWVTYSADGATYVLRLEEDRPVRIQPVLPEGDANGDGIVDTQDLLAVLAGWGGCGDCTVCPADVDGDCMVGTSDILTVLGNWS